VARDGVEVPPFYDSLLAKLIVWGPDRPTCRRGARGRCARSRSRGIATTAPLLAELLDEELVRPRRLPHHDAGGVACMSRYSWGADEHLFVELAEEMSLRRELPARWRSPRAARARPDGLLDICPANASYPGALRPGRARAAT
jgi:hypothetical protein